VLAYQDDVSTDIPLSQKTAYIRDLETTMMISGIRSELPLPIKLAGYLPIPSIQHALTLRKRLDAYGAQAIANHKAVVQANPSAADSGLFARFMDPKRNAELSDVEIAEEASNLIVAGSDTTAVSLTYLVWALLKPENSIVREKLLAEIAPLSPSAGMAEISTLPFLKATVDEALRLYGAAPGSQPRVVLEGGAMLGSYALPAGVVVSTQAYTLHRDARIWREPERWVILVWFWLYLKGLSC
jgi:cytochrome P450